MRGGRPLVGRDRELAQLTAALERAVSGNGGVQLLVGEAGIGKSRLAEELAARATQRGVAVAWGRAWEAGGAPAFWPWVEILRTLLESKSDAELRAQLGAGAPDVVQLLPEIAERLTLSSAAPAPVAERFRLFDSVSNVIVKSAAQKPLLIVAEDLHAADQPTLLLLAFVAQRVGGARVLILGNYRAVEARLSPETADLLAKVGRYARTIDLKNLDREHVAELVAASDAQSSDPALVDRLYDATEGHPLFVDEVLRLIELDAGAPGDAIPVPDGVRGAIRELLLRISDDAMATLEVAAAVGRRFPLTLVSRVGSLPADQVRKHLASAVRLGVLAEVTAKAGHYQFSHVLVREVVHDSTSDSRRAALHLAIAGELEQVHAADPEAPLAEIAHHLQQAGPDAAPRALDALVRASRRSIEKLAFEESAAHLEAALATLDLVAAGDARRRHELLLELGGARIRAGKGDKGKQACVQAAQIARQLGSAEMLARAALELGNRFIFGLIDRTLVELLEESLARLGPEDSALRARAMARLAAALQPSSDPRVPVQMAKAAIDVARRIGDRGELLAVLQSAGAALAAMELPERRLPFDQETVRLALELREKGIALRAWARLVWDHLELADIPSAEAAIRAYEALAAELGLPHVVWQGHMFRATLAGFHGRFAEAEKLTAIAKGIVERAGERAAYHYFQIHRLVSALATDDHAVLRGECREIVEGLKSVVPEVSILTVMAAAVEARSNDVEATRRLLDGTPRESWIAVSNTDQHQCFAESVYVARDRERAEFVYPRIVDTSGHMTVWGNTGFCIQGPADRGLMLLALTLERWDDAERHFEIATRLAKNLGADPALALVQVEYAEALDRRARPGDATRVKELAKSAAEIGRRLGMEAVVARAEALLDTGVPSAAPVSALDELTRRVQEEKLSSLGHLVAGIAHEINNPLGALQANADVLQRAFTILKDALDDEEIGAVMRKNARVARAIQTLESSRCVTPDATHRISNVVRALRSFARLDQADEDDVDVRQLVDGALRLIEHEIEGRISVERRYQDVPKIRCRPLQLNEVFLNILRNAVQATSGPGTITASIESHGPFVSVVISDTGAGIAPEHLGRIFDPGFTTKGVGVGVGLGLSIAYRIVHAHGGTIAVESARGRGSDFTIRLPVEPPRPA